METRANYVLVGLFTLVVIAAAFAFIYWVSRIDESSGLVPLKIRIVGEVTGLGEGSDVLFNGIKVGKVNRVEFDRADPRVVFAIAGVKATTPLRADTSATIGSQGLTGVAYISLKGGTPEAAPLLEGEGEAVIDAAPSALGDILETVRLIAGRADTMMTTLDSFIKENRVPATQAISNVEKFSQALARNADGVDKFLASVSTVADSLQTLSARLDGAIAQAEKILNAVDPAKVRATVDNVEDFTAKLKGAGDGVKEVVAAAQASMKQIQTFSEGVNASLVKVDGLIAAVDPQKLKGVVDDLSQTAKSARDVASTVQARRGDIDKIITDTSELAAKLNASSSRIDGVLAKLDGFLGSADGEGLSGDIRKTLADFRETSQSLRARVNEVAAGLSKFSGRGLDDVRALVQDTRRSIDRIDRVVTDIGNDPQKLITGGSQPRQFDGRPRR